MAFYLGIDGGGTKTRCSLGDEDSVVAAAASSGSNVVRVGAAAAREALHSAVREVCAAAKISPNQIKSLCIGVAGAARPKIAAAVRRMLTELTPASIEVVGDMVIALEAAFGSGAGVMAIAGTGSIVYGRDADGHTVRAGGWGFAISDEGSGHWIGRRAISAILHAYDEGKECHLTAALLHAWNLETLEELVQTANAPPAAGFPRLFPVVLQASSEGDPLARELLAEAGSELAKLAALVIRRLPHPPYAPVAMTGSVFRQSADVRQVFYNRLEANFPGIEIRSELVDPVEGALALARKLGQKKG
jgi:N-acetylglucosamine kinase-like BadF-type ATPase